MRRAPVGAGGALLLAGLGGFGGLAVCALPPASPQGAPPSAIAAAAPAAVAVGPPPQRLPLQRQPGSQRPEGPGYSLARAADGQVDIHYQQQGRARQIRFTPPDEIDVTVEASVTESPRLVQELVYTYRLASAATSRQRTADLVVAFAGIVEDVRAPAGWVAKPVPTMTALDWSSSAGLAAGGTAGDFSFATRPRPETARLAGPDGEGGADPGFVHSRGSLPGIVDCFVVGAAPLPAVLSSAPPPALLAVVAALPRFPRTGAGGRTVGPVDIPASDTMNALLGSMIQYARDSVQLGWIGRPETAERYVKALAAIRRDSSAGTLGGPMAYQRLQTVARQADIDLGTHALGSEAHALLKHNAAWLASWAAEPQRGEP